MTSSTRKHLIQRNDHRSDQALAANPDLQAEIAANYFALRSNDVQIAIYVQSIALYQRSLDIVKTQFAGAIASALDWLPALN